MKDFSVSMALVDYIPVLSFICSLGMGYLSAQDFAEASMNWIAEGVNIVGQGTLLIGTVLLHKNGLTELSLEKA